MMWASPAYWNSISGRSMAQYGQWISSISTSMGNGGSGGLVNQASADEAVESEGCGDRVGIAAGKCRCEHMGGAGRGLETAGSPTTIDEQARHWRLADDRRAVGCHVDDAAPVAQHAQAAEHRKQLANSFERVPCDVQSAGLAVRRVGIG